MTVITAPVRKTVDVNCSTEDAFEVFTSQIASWWPKAEYSVSGARVSDVVFEARVGGRIYEVRDDGVELEWGRVTECEAPNRLVFDWFPGSDPAKPTEVEVRFTSAGSGTRVELEHRNWERLGEKAGNVREGYDGGWIEVLAAFEARVP